ncbi:MAG: tetratricopeptide repeat protein [Verrucomicrobia bacterium]|nr:tetratricopeptide repeat protein [Verrucomicrobiota bacterium]
MIAISGEWVLPGWGGAALAYFLSHVWLLVVAFQIWMLVDAIRRGEWVWAVLIFLFSGLTALFYFFLVYRAAPRQALGFELPGAADRRRIKELQDQIHHLDKAYHHAQLADIYLHQSKLDLAETHYRAALEREPDDGDTRAHLGRCLLSRHKAAEARPLLAQVVADKPDHDYGYTMMALAEALGELGDAEGALAVWEHVVENHSYARARIKLAELLLARNQTERARRELEQVVADDAHAPAFHRRQERAWVRQAKQMLWRLNR